MGLLSKYGLVEMNHLKGLIKLKPKRLNKLSLHLGDNDIDHSPLYWCVTWLWINEGVESGVVCILGNHSPFSPFPLQDAALKSF